MKRIGAATIAMALVPALGMAAASGATSAVTAHAVIPAFAIVTIGVERSDVAPYMPAGFSGVDAGGQTAIHLSVARFTNTSFDYGDRSAARTAVSFAYSDLKIATLGPEGSGPDSGGVLNLWRLASSSEFPEAMRHVGLACDETAPPRTRICVVPHLTIATKTTTSATGVEVRAEVPWGASAYKVSASFLSTALPCAICLPFSGWHAGVRGPVKESPTWAAFPASAIIGVGRGSVRVARGSALFHILGDREEADGSAILLRGHVDATFAAP